jgi:polyribonucleotide nucleotidyltransferase
VVSVDNAGVVGISASSDAAMVLATELVRAAVMEVEEGVVYRGCRVVKCLAFGAFVEVLPGKDGLVHISELSEERTANVTDVVNEGDVIDVKCIGIESNGKVRLSLKAVKAELKGPPAAPTTGAV